MKHSFHASGLVLICLALQACNTSGSGTVAGNGDIVAQSNMPEYCQTTAATRYGAPLGNVTTVSPVPRDFGFLVTGTANTGLKTYIFNCRFGQNGAFLGLSEA